METVDILNVEDEETKILLESFTLNMIDSKTILVIAQLMSNLISSQAETTKVLGVMQKSNMPWMLFKCLKLRISQYGTIQKHGIEEGELSDLELQTDIGRLVAVCSKLSQNQMMAKMMALEFFTPITRTIEPLNPSDQLNLAVMEKEAKEKGYSM
eukprot:CAMPEP_0117428886 /NCGR_PEP_ID=MMETSP0758-20121206/8498_1 /TAXON_ID=63605 /ORGANISM="Percolomonas cosmopolitus, Strain AE-1 (ATCC 50343)" /LENGTH=154 /DNA_ID=CAMNT_0005215499 /DNA_START=396 /DNA_END=857 /DNA_ORIENTATION=+